MPSGNFVACKRFPRIAASAPNRVGSREPATHGVLQRGPRRAQDVADVGNGSSGVSDLLAKTQEIFGLLEAAR